MLHEAELTMPYYSHQMVADLKFPNISTRGANPTLKKLCKFAQREWLQYKLPTCPIIFISIHSQKMNEGVSNISTLCVCVLGWGWQTRQIWWAWACWTSGKFPDLLAFDLLLIMYYNLCVSSDELDECWIMIGWVGVD